MLKHTHHECVRPQRRRSRGTVHVPRNRVRDVWHIACARASLNQCCKIVRPEITWPSLSSVKIETFCYRPYNMGVSWRRSLFRSLRLPEIGTGQVNAANFPKSEVQQTGGVWPEAMRGAGRYRSLKSGHAPLLKRRCVMAWVVDGVETPACPQCGSMGLIRIVYGLPGPELVDAAKRGEVILGGCQVAHENRVCRSCGARFHLDEPRPRVSPEDPVAETKDEGPKQYELFVDDNFHFLEDTAAWAAGEPLRGRSALNTYATYEEALAEAKRIVDECLLEIHKPGMRASELYERYQNAGLDPFICPDPSPERFNGWKYAKRRAKEMCAGVSEVLPLPG
jgi:hypothetical protein